MDDKNKKGWFQQNWKWFVPTGCLTTLMLFALAIVGILYGVMSVIKSTPVYKKPMELVNQDRRTVDILGSPIEAGFFIQGNINTSGPKGSADLSIPVKGPKGKGVIYVSAWKKEGRWEYKILEIEIEGQAQRIKLR